MDVKYMKTFGENSVYKHPDLDIISSVSELPEEMRLMYQDVNPEASMASFICYCMDKNIPNKYIVARSGFTESEVIKIVKEAKSEGIYYKLCSEFLK